MVESSLPMTAEAWRKLGFTEIPPMRAQILELTIEELTLGGIGHFRMENVCERLHITRTLINHHFENRDRLVSEAVTIAYGRYVEALRSAASAASTPLSRLEAWMLAQVKWTRRNRGIAALIHLPDPKLAEVQNSLFAAEIERIFKLNMSVLAELVRGAQNDTMNSLDFADVDREYAALVDDLSFLMLLSSTALSSLGSSVWVAGPNRAATGLPEYFLNDILLMQHIRWIASSAASGKLGQARVSAFDAKTREQAEEFLRGLSAEAEFLEN